MSEMRLLVSVKNAEEAMAALAGGADLIDAKDPAAGALGAVSLDVLRDIHSTVAGLRPVSAALGDAIDEAANRAHARAYALAGASLVKIGFAGVSSRMRVGDLITAAMRGAAHHADVIAVAYADADRAAQPRSTTDCRSCRARRRGRCAARYRRQAWTGTACADDAGGAGRVGSRGPRCRPARRPRGQTLG